MDSVGSLFEKLVWVFKELRDPVRGCPWDLEQSHQSLKPYLIEEAYEFLDAIDRAPDKMPEELGDVLLQVMLHAQLGADEKRFTISDVISQLHHKLVKRHPHVFGDKAVKDSAEVLKNWEQIKAEDRKDKESILDGIPKGLPALLKAHRIGAKVGRVGFDWSEDITQAIPEIIKKVEEELAEVKAAIVSNDKKSLTEELGDLLFCIAQLGRRLAIDSEDSLQQACRKFTERFAWMEQNTTKLLNQCTSAELEALWQRAKVETQP